MNGKTCGSENDGAAWRSRWSQSTRQHVKSGVVPLLSLEVVNSFLKNDKKIMTDSVHSASDLIMDGRVWAGTMLT